MRGTNASGTSFKRALLSSESAIEQCTSLSRHAVLDIDTRDRARATLLSFLYLPSWSASPSFNDFPTRLRRLVASQCCDYFLGRACALFDHTSGRAFHTAKPARQPASCPRPIRLFDQWIRTPPVFGGQFRGIVAPGGVDLTFATHLATSS